MKLLVVEDGVKLAEHLRKGLTESGCVVGVAHDGIDGLHLAMEGNHDLLVLDRMLPGSTAWRCLQPCACTVADRLRSVRTASR